MAGRKHRGPALRQKPRDEHLEEVAELDRRGYSQGEIARKTGVTQQQINYDLKQIRQTYLEGAAETYALKVAEKKRQYRDIRREAWEAWEKSKEEALRVVDEEVTSASGRGGHTRRTETREGRLPDVSYLRTVIDTLKQECDLEGLNQPLQVQGQVNVIDWNRLFQQAEDHEVDDVERKLHAIDQVLKGSIQPLESTSPPPPERIPGVIYPADGPTLEDMSHPNYPGYRPGQSSPHPDDTGTANDTGSTRHHDTGGPGGKRDTDDTTSSPQEGRRQQGNGHVE